MSIMNKFYRPIISLSRLFYCTAINHQLVQNARRAFPERILLDMRQIENIWRRSKDNKVLNKYLYNCYVQNPELSNYAVDIIHFACNRSSVSYSLIYEMIQTFSNYISESKSSVSFTLEQKVDVLSSVMSFKKHQLIQLVCAVFKFLDKPLIFMPFIKSLIKEKKYADAACLVSVLNLQKEFDIEEILMPVIFEGSIQAAIFYLKACPDIQLKVVKFLDGYLNKNSAIPIDSHLKPKKVFKTLTSFLQAFKIPLDTCPNLQFIRSKGAINVLVKRRNEQSVSEATFEEMIKNIVQDDDDLKKLLIQKLIKMNDKKTAMKMSEVFNINVPDLHCLEANCENTDKFVFSDIDNGHVEDSGDSQNFDIYDISDEYLKFTLKTEDIKVIDNKEDFIHCINDMHQNYKMIGVDSEWKPYFGLSRERLSIIQLAVHDKIYILDLLVLSECLNTEDWDKLLDDIFGNPNVIKLGCGILTDVNMILENIKGTKGKSVKFSHILDMALFYEKLQEVYPVEMQSDSDKPFTRSLSSLCNIILGKPLNKENRLCDWEKRPLMKEQLGYAALDAHCLLLMYDKLKKESVKKEINFEHLAKVAIVLTTSQWKPRKRIKGVKNSEDICVNNLVPVEQLKIVIESTFEKQGKELRKLGADVIILKAFNSADTAVELSKNEGRIVVCTETLYNKVKYRLKEGFCYCFYSSGDIQYQVTHFLQQFNAQVSTKSIFSRCLSCNSNQGVKLSSEDLKILHELGKAQTSMNAVIRDNLSDFSSDLQTALSDILNSDIEISLSSKSSSYFINEFAFLCKSCGNIS